MQIITNLTTTTTSNKLNEKSKKIEKGGRTTMKITVVGKLLHSFHTSLVIDRLISIYKYYHSVLVFT